MTDRHCRFQQPDRSQVAVDGAAGRGRTRNESARPASSPLHTDRSRRAPASWRQPPLNLPGPKPGPAERRSGTSALPARSPPRTNPASAVPARVPSKPRHQQRVPSAERTRRRARGSCERATATRRTRSWLRDPRRAAALCPHHPEVTEKHRLTQVARAACPADAHGPSKLDHSLVSVARPKSVSRHRFEARPRRNGFDPRNNRGSCAQSSTGPEGTATTVQPVTIDPTRVHLAMGCAQAEASARPVRRHGPKPDPSTSLRNARRSRRSSSRYRSARSGGSTRRSSASSIEPVCSKSLSAPGLRNRRSGNESHGEADEPEGPSASATFFFPSPKRGEAPGDNGIRSEPLHRRRNTATDQMSLRVTRLSPRPETR